MTARCVTLALVLLVAVGDDAPAGEKMGAPQAAQAAALNPTLLKMADNTWVNLKPKGMPWARTYSGACFGGGRLWYFGGAHRSYPGNDVHLYDPRTNEWTQATEAEKPEPGSKEWKSLTGGGGGMRRLTPKGRPFVEHTYQQVCWLPDRRQFFIALVTSGTWTFDPVKREWGHLINRLENRGADPRGYWAQNHTLYEPAFGAPVLIVGGGGAQMYRFEMAAKRWKSLGACPKELNWNEFYSTYVPQWKGHLISTMRKGFFRFDVPARKLVAVETPEPLKRCQSLSYDAAGGVVIALAPKKVDRYRRTVTPWALDVATMKWQPLEPTGPTPVGQCTGAWATLWYDAAHNVHLLVNFVRRDRQRTFDGGVTETWAYRYKRATPKKDAPAERAKDESTP
jgi:hypothetical protein